MMLAAYSYMADLNILSYPLIRKTSLENGRDLIGRKTYPVKRDSFFLENTILVERNATVAIGRINFGGEPLLNE